MGIANKLRDLMHTKDINASQLPTTLKGRGLQLAPEVQT